MAFASGWADSVAGVRCLTMKPDPAPLHNILVVDDTIEALRLLANILGEHRYEVRPVTNGRQALLAVERDPPDLILLAINPVAPADDTVGAVANVTRLSVLLGDVPADLRARLRTAAVEARAPHLDKLADEVARHSTAAADQIRALAARFDYDLLLEALPQAAE